MDNNNMDKYLGQMLDNRYEILEVIGAGGMAVVYKAKCHLLNRFVAVKILRDDMAADEEFRARFNKEAQAVAMLSHPNIVSVYDVSRSPELDYIVMELIEGITLKQYMKSKGRLSCKESLHFTTQIGRALSQAHHKGIVHRDIKPQNIMIGLDGSVKVADFGIAYLETAQAVETGMAVGSVHYISPEQAKGQTVDARSDIYSLGVVMYEMLCGQLPFTGETAEAVALQHVSAAPVPPKEVCPEIPDSVEMMVLKAMNGDIEQRYQNVDELLSDIDNYRQESSKPAVSAVKTDEELPEQEEKTPEEESPEEVIPIGRSGELSKESYARRRRRANKISLLSGFFLVVVFIIAVFVFLWNYWLSDIFSDTVRISIPNFVGSSRDEIVNNKEFLELYNFEVVTVIDPGTEAGEIIAQDPDAGKSMIEVSGGIPVKLTVSTGMQMLRMIDVVNQEYKSAVIALQKEGFFVDPEFVSSNEVTENYVISTNPEKGDELPAGSTVYMLVSSGPETVMVPVPNLVGLSESAAISKIESAGLTYGRTSAVEDDMPAGTVVWQSIDAYTEVEEHAKIFIQVSTGPKPEPSPEVEEPEEPVPETERPVRGETMFGTGSGRNGG